MYWLLYLIVVGLATYWLMWRYKQRRIIKMVQKIPGPPALPLIGNGHEFICQSEDFNIVIKKLTLQYGDVVTLWLGSNLNVIISDPEDIKTLLTNPKTSIKGPQYKYIAQLLGGGIFSGSGPKWKQHRKMATPNYAKRNMDKYTKAFNKEVDVLLETLRKMDKEHFDIYTVFVHCTSIVVCQTLMGLTKEQTLNLPHLRKVIDDTPGIYDIVFARMYKWHLQIDPVFWMTRSYWHYKHFTKIVTEFGQQIIQHRLDWLDTIKETTILDSDPRLSVIDRFILSKELSQDDLMSETLTIFTSSQEPAAKVAAAVILMMAYHPKCQEKLYAEIKSVLGDKDRSVSEEDFRQMPYLEMVFKEVIRLLPVGLALQRTVSEDIEISTCTLPAGCSFVVPIYHVHRDPRFWTNPDAFDPERFTPENMKNRNPNCYIPFSMGPMDCLGRHFGAKLIKTMCVRVLREYKFTSPETYEDMRISMAIAAVPLNGYPVFLRPRKIQ